MKALLLAALLAADGGTPPPVYHLTKPTLVPAGHYVLPPASWAAVDGEMKRLQYVEKNPPPGTVPVEGYLIGMAVVATVFLAGGVALGYVASKELK